MITEPSTLYKLMILYLLKSASYPLLRSHILAFFLDNSYTTYPTIQVCLSELTDAKLIEEHRTQNSSRFEITKEGADTLDLFRSDITSGAIEDMDRFLRENKISLQMEASNFTDYSKSDDGNYQVRLEVREEKSLLYSLDITVPDKDSAERMCGNWARHNSEIYAFIIQKLLGGREHE